MKSISVIGLGKLGLPLSVIYASKGFKVYGIDINADVLKAINTNKIFIYEQGFNQLFSGYKKNLLFSSDSIDAVEKSDITYVVVPTPSKKQGDFELFYVLQVIKDIAQKLKEKKTKHTIVITSTISPNSMQIIAQTLERVSKKVVGKDLGLCYSPEFIALGNAIHNFTNPDFILIGESDPESGKLVAKIRSSICRNSPKIKRTNFINAEIAKIALNTYITTKISFSNMVARIAEKTPRADVDDITDILGSDSRIGDRYLKGGLAYGGPCFPRDNNALSHFMKNSGIDPLIPKIIDKFNRSQNDYLYDFVKKLIKKNEPVGILGLTYKSDTNVIDESSGIFLANNLSKSGVVVNVYDPSLKTKPLELDKKVNFFNSTNDCIDKSDIIVINTPWKEFKKINFGLFKKNKYLIDCWRILRHELVGKINYIAFGQNSVC